MKKQKKKIAFIHSNLAGGGAEREIVILSNWFVEQEHDVEIYLFGQNTVVYNLDSRVKVICPDRSKYTLKDRINRIESIIKRKSFNRLEARIRDYIRRSPGRVIIAMLNVSVITVMRSVEDDITSGKIKNKFIFMECSIRNNCTPERDKLRNKYYAMADHCAFLTPEIMDTFPEEVRKNGVVIPNAVAEGLPERHEGQRKNIIVSFCRLSRSKNLFLLIDAFALFNKDYPDFQLKIYGNGELKDELNKHIEKLGLSDAAKILPFQKNIHEIINDSYMHIASSDWEGFCNSLIEAMAMGLPTICTEWVGGSSKMLIDDHENGLLVPCGDVQSMYKAMKYMADNPDEAERMGRNATKIREEYSVDKIAQKWIELF